MLPVNNIDPPWHTSVHEPSLTLSSSRQSQRGQSHLEASRTLLCGADVCRTPSQCVILDLLFMYLLIYLFKFILLLLLGLFVCLFSWFFFFGGGGGLGGGLLCVFVRWGRFIDLFFPRFFCFGRGGGGGWCFCQEGGDYFLLFLPRVNVH